MWRGLQGRGEAVGGALVSHQRQGEGGGCCCCGRRGRRRVVGVVKGGTRGPVGLGAWGAAPAAAIKRERKKKCRNMERGARLSQE